VQRAIVGHEVSEDHQRKSFVNVDSHETSNRVYNVLKQVRRNIDRGHCISHPGATSNVRSVSRASNDPRIRRDIEIVTM
jgi:hypothetical protein